MQYIIGTSGWMYSDWNERFYPKGMKSDAKLAYFAGQFGSVEINSTFYHMPLESSVQRWFDVTPDAFVFAIKMNRYLTHTRHLLPDAEFDETLRDFYERISHLRHKLGVVLVQLPPSMKLDYDRLRHLAEKTAEYEKLFGMRFPLAIEFRNKSWFADDTWKLLRELGIANVVIDSPGRWPASREVTGPLGYFRFHGSQQLYRSSYTDEELTEWASYMATACKDCTKVFAYFNNDYGGVAIDNARTLQRIITNNE